MKKVLYILILLTVLTYGQPSQWNFLNPLPDSQGNLSIEAINGKLYVCGLFGKIITSSDQGATWERQEWQTTRNLFEVDFNDNDNGIIVGGKADIFKTTNGGKNWIRKTASKAMPLRDVEYFNSKVVLAVGDGEYILRSSDAGETWDGVKLPGRFTLWGICYNSKNKVGLACGISSKSASILRTTDEGQNWTDVSSVIEDTISYWDINFADENTAFAVGGSVDYQVIRKSTDAGKTWKTINTKNLGLGYYSALESVRFADKNTGIIVGHSGVIIRTTDGGETWTLNDLRLPDDLDDVEFVDANNAYIVGGNGLIMKSSDAGLTWSKAFKGFNQTLYRTSFISPLDGVAVGTMGAILTTKNGGKEWNQIAPDGNYPLLGVKMISKDHIVAVGGHSYANGYGVIAATSNGGSTWSFPQLPFNFYPVTVDFFDNKNGLLAGYNSNPDVYDRSSAIIYKTSDGGFTWEKLTAFTDPNNDLPPLAMQILSSDRAIIMGEYGSFFVTNDKGNSWSYLSKLQFNSTTTSMNFLNELSGYVSSMNGIFKTSDGGKTWKMIFDGTTTGSTVKSVYFCNSSTGYAVGSGATSPNFSLIMKTTDGGINWNYDFPPSVNGLEAVFAVNDTTAFAVGDGGTILANHSPGVVSSVSAWLQPVSDYSLSQNYPNPFNPNTIINYSIPGAARVILKVYNIMGKEVALLVDSYKPAGRHSVRFNAANLSSGVYFYTITAGDFTSTKKMIYLR